MVAQRDYTAKKITELDIAIGKKILRITFRYKENMGFRSRFRKQKKKDGYQ